MSSSVVGTHFKVDLRSNGVALVTLDTPDSKVNVLNKALMVDFEALIKRIETDSDIKSVVVLSGKSDTWIAGADIKMLDACSSEEEYRTLIKDGHRLFNALANSPKPVVAAINGSCLGGGLETALACHYRIATSSKKTQLGVPEVQLGLLPGGGGTQRLPKAVGLTEALKMATMGGSVKPDKAKKIGLVHQVADPHALEFAAIQAAEGLMSGKLKPPTRNISWMDWALEGPLKGVVFKKAREAARTAAGGLYVAPTAIIDCIEAGWRRGLDAGLQEEVKQFSKLAVGPQSKALRGIFFGMTQLKKNKYGDPSFSPKTIAVLGAGLMGAGIAQVSAVQGKYKVIIKDKDAKGLARGQGQIYNNLSSQVKKKKMTSFERDTLMSNVMGLTDASPKWQENLANADILIEAVFEDLKVKHRVIAELEPILKPHAIIATNTSAIPIGEIAKGSSRPSRIVGMHYFSPVDKMPLLELIPHAGTDKDVLAAATQIGLKQGKTVITVKDVPGFYVNRCLGPFLAEVMALTLQGVKFGDMDKAMIAAGMPVGPITLADEVGVDVANHLQYNLKELGIRMYTGSDANLMQQVVDAGFLGKKTGKGFYLHPPGKQKGPKQVNPEVEKVLGKYVDSTKPVNIKTSEIQNRVLGRLINEAAMCLQDGIIASAVDGDMGMVFGIGFFPGHGGPFRYIDNLGAQVFVDRMNAWADAHGEQFRPAQILVDMAKSGKKFHP